MANERRPLTCKQCRCTITQDEADRAARIFAIVGLGPDGTFCPSCAKAVADDGENDDEFS